MTKVDFYVLQTNDPAARLAFACRLAEKVWQKNHCIYLHTKDQQQAEILQKQLWNHNPQRFLPAKILTTQILAANSTIKNSTAHNPITIGYGDHAGNQHDVLINLTDSIPSFFSRFERITEIVTQQKEQLEQLRENYQFYQKRGYPLKTHKL